MNALILVDLQNDFMEGSPLGVPGAQEIIPLANRLQEKFDYVLAAQDWHPADHGSFATNHPGKEPGEVVMLHGLDLVLWPTHCVTGTEGAEFVGGLKQDKWNAIFKKGVDARVDSYSGFYDNGHLRGTGLDEYLQEHGIQQVYILGVATDYCVQHTALDAYDLGYET